METAEPRFLLLLWLALGATCVGVSQALTDYCDPSLCGANRAHVGCNATDTFGSQCPDNTEIIEMDQKQRDLILKLHNNLRSELASGKMEGFAEAERMAVLTWDDELAKLAEYNVRTCLYSHDGCRSTERYPAVGQNIARKSKVGNVSIDVDRAISDLTNKWWQEYVDTNQTVLDAYQQVGEGVHVGGFTLMANDRVSAVGCSATRYYNPGNKRSYVYYVCNYTAANVHGQPVYVRGQQCAKCSGPCSTTYPGLCDANPKA